MADNTYTPDVSTDDGRRELNRRIAQARGWKLIDAPPKRGKPGFTMVIRETDDPFEQYDILPNFADDNSDALELLAGCSYAYHHRPGRPDHVLIYDMSDGLLISESYADTFAGAAALAWWSAFGRGEGE